MSGREHQRDQSSETKGPSHAGPMQAQGRPDQPREAGGDMLHARIAKVPDHKAAQGKGQSCEAGRREAAPDTPSQNPHARGGPESVQRQAEAQGVPGVQNQPQKDVRRIHHARLAIGEERKPKPDLRGPHRKLAAGPSARGPSPPGQSVVPQIVGEKDPHASPNTGHRQSHNEQGGRQPGPSLGERAQGSK